MKKHAHCVPHCVRWARRTCNHSQGKTDNTTRPTDDAMNSQLGTTTAAPLSVIEKRIFVGLPIMWKPWGKNLKTAWSKRTQVCIKQMHFEGRVTYAFSLSTCGALTSWFLTEGTVIHDVLSCTADCFRVTATVVQYYPEHLCAWHSSKHFKYMTSRVPQSSPLK